MGFWVLVTKYITLTNVSIISTLICLLAVGMTSWIIFTVIDTMINSWCVLLMYSDNKKLFGKLCYHCNIYCGHKCVETVTRSSVYSGSIEYNSRTMSPKASRNTQHYFLME